MCTLATAILVVAILLLPVAIANPVPAPYVRSLEDVVSEVFTLSPDALYVFPSRSKIETAVRQALVKDGRIRMADVAAPRIAERFAWKCSSSSALLTGVGNALRDTTDAAPELAVELRYFPGVVEEAIARGLASVAIHEK